MFNFLKRRKLKPLEWPNGIGNIPCWCPNCERELVDDGTEVRVTSYSYGSGEHRKDVRAKCKVCKVKKFHDGFGGDSSEREFAMRCVTGRV